MWSLPPAFWAAVSALLWSLLLGALAYIWAKVDKRLENLEHGQRKNWDAIIRMEDGIAQMRENMVRDVDCAEYRSKLRLDMANHSTIQENLRVQIESLKALRCCK